MVRRILPVVVALVSAVGIYAVSAHPDVTAITLPTHWVPFSAELHTTVGQTPVMQYRSADGSFASYIQPDGVIRMWQSNTFRINPRY